ncbi:MAG: O-antigen ligase family protein [Rugosibacter sp.]
MKQTSVLAPAAVALASVVLGAATVVYVGWASGSMMRVAVLPLVIALLALLTVDKRRLFLLIMLFRTIGDPIFDATRFSLGGVNIGAGAALNALMILIALLFFIERPVTQSRPRIPLWVPLILLVLVASVLRSPDRMNALRTMLVLVSYAAVFAIPFYVGRNNGDIRVAIRIVLLSSLLPVLYAFVDIALNWGGGGAEGFRLKSSFSHPNIFAFYLLLVVSLLLYRLKASMPLPTTGKRWLLGCYMVFLLGLLVLTKTRSAWLACFFIFGAYGALFERRMLLYLVAVPLLALLVPDVRDRLLDLTVTNDYDPYAQLNSFDWRVQIWKSGIAWMKPLSLLIGYGLDSFSFYSPQFFDLAGNINFAAHNVYVQWFFETGALGMLCLGWVFYCVLRMLGRNLETDKAGAVVMILLVLAYLLVCASDNMIDYLSFNWYFWFIVGTACSTSLAKKPLPREMTTAHAPASPAPMPRRRRLVHATRSSGRVQ